MKTIHQKQIERKIRKEKDERDGKVRHEKVHINDLASIFKGLGNHYRIKILIAIYKNKNITLDQINAITGGDFKNISAHTKKLENLGLVKKKYQNRYVQHYLSADGKYFTELVISNLLNTDL